MSGRQQRGGAGLAERDRSLGSGFKGMTHAAALEEPAIEQTTEEKEELERPWQVVVHNDPVNLMSYVTMVFQRVFGYPRAEAEEHMLEVHQKGICIVWGGMR